MSQSQSLPEPPVPADCDLKDFGFTPIYRARLFGSGFHARATDSEWRAGVTLWLKSWDQVPAGSLPDDDVDLCRLAELGRDQKTWLKVKKGAMHGWQRASDGRLYHPVVAEVVMEAWEKRSKASTKGKAGASKRWGSGNATATKSNSTGIGTGNARAIAQAMPGDSKGQGREEKGRKEIHPASSQPYDLRDAAAAKDSTDAHAEARAIIAVLDEEIVAHFGPPAERMCPAPTDLVHADRLVAAGWTARTVQPIIAEAMALKASSNQQPISRLAWFEKRFADISVGGSMPPPDSRTSGHGAKNGGHPAGWVDWQNDPAEVAWTKAFDEWCRLPKKVRETQKKPVVEDFHHLRPQKAS